MFQMSDITHLPRFRRPISGRGLVGLGSHPTGPANSAIEKRCKVCFQSPVPSHSAAPGPFSGLRRLCLMASNYPSPYATPNVTVTTSPRAASAATSYSIVPAIIPVSFSFAPATFRRLPEGVRIRYCIRLPYRFVALTTRQLMLSVHELRVVAGPSHARG